MAESTTTHQKAGRTPSTQMALVHILRQHPELLHRPKDIARLLRRNPAFESITPKAISSALNKLKKRNNGRPPSISTCEDCLGRIVCLHDQELVCQNCGRSYGYAESPDPNNHTEFSNNLWQAYNSKRSNSPVCISNEAARIQQFGQGPKGRLLERSLVALAELMKSHPEIGQQHTDRIGGLLISKCELRAKEISRVAESDVRDCITLALLSYAESFPQFKQKMIELIHDMSEFFPDLSVTVAKSSKFAKLSGLDIRELD